MKNLVLFMVATLLSTPAWAQIDYDEQEVRFKELVSIYSLNCVIPLNRDLPVEERIFTELREHHFTAGSHESILMNHREAIQTGCDLETLDQLVDESRMRFGHIEAQITVKKGLARKPRIVFGQCSKSYREQIVIDLGHGIVLMTPLVGTLLPATGCDL